MAAYISGMSNTIWAFITRWPRPSVEPMNISATITMTSASDTPERMPTKTWGMDSSRVTSVSTRQRGARITRAASWRCLRAPITP